MQGFHVENFGCRAARADGEAVSDRLRTAGLCEREPAQADVVIVNTCSVTAEADRAARAFIRRAHRLNPAARIVVTGCYAQRAPQELAALPGVSAVVGNSHKALTPAIAIRLAEPSTKRRGFVSGHDFSRAENATKWKRALAPVEYDSDISDNDSHDSRANPEHLPASPTGLVHLSSLVAPASSSSIAPIFVDDRFAHSFLEEAQIIPGTQTRPNLKIQEGCSNRCTFCVIPQTRGSSRSLAFSAVLGQVEGFVAAGGNELVLSGINLGRWGRDLAPSADSAAHDSNPRTLASLARRILTQTALPRLRLSSIEPMDWDAELIGLMAEFGGNRLARHAHLPLQSGSDAVLRRMHRRYRPWHYVEKVEALQRAAGPELTLGADVMVGFPGETEGEFEETLELVRKLPFGYLHLFPFSPRPGTRGWALHAERPVPGPVAEERMAVLRALAAEKSETHRRWFVGRELEAIALHTPVEMASAGRTAALTENFLPLEIEGRLAVNQLVLVRVTGFTAKGTLHAIEEKSQAAQYLAMTMSV